MFSKVSIITVLIATVSIGGASAATLRGGSSAAAIDAVRSLGQVMCPVEQPTDTTSCPQNKEESCKYDNGVLNFSYSDTTCACQPLLGSSTNEYKWKCAATGSVSHQVMCPLDKPQHGGMCPQNKNESCKYDNDSTVCSCDPLIGNTHGDYAWNCSAQCPTKPDSFMDDNQKPKQCYHAGQSCEDNYCLTCKCEPLMGNTKGEMMWNCQPNGNCHV
jgi:hypothetical protein